MTHQQAAQHSRSWACRLKASAEDPTLTLGFLLWATSGLDLWTEARASSWHAWAEAHPPSAHPLCEVSHTVRRGDNWRFTSKHVAEIELNAAVTKLCPANLKMIWSLSVTTATYFSMLSFITTAVFLRYPFHVPNTLGMHEELCLPLNRTAIQHIQAFTASKLHWLTYFYKCSLLHTQIVGRAKKKKYFSFPY